MRLHETAFYIAVFFIAGIALASFGVNIWLVAGTFGIGIILNFFTRKRWIWFALGVTIFFGFFYFHIYSAYNNQNIPFSENITLSGVIVSDPDNKFKHQEFDIKLDDPHRGLVRVYTALYPKFSYSDLLELKGSIEKSPSGRINVLGFPEIEIKTAGHGRDVQSALFRIKNGMVDNLRKVLPLDKAALASGILLGEREEFSDELKDAMAKSGTTHIVALSGYNVSIIAILISSLLGNFISRKKSFYISIVAIIAFVLMTGAEASVVRAAIMGIIALVATQSSRIHSVRNAITLTAFAMLLFNPTLLVFDVGFQFSFLALLGLIYIEPRLRALFGIRRGQKISGWKNNLLQTASAQIAVAPVALYTFGYISVFSLAANVLIMEFIPITMALAFLTAVSGFAFYPLSLIISWLTGMVLGYEIFIINLFSFSWL